jgi:hypothetical protein
MFVDGLNGFGKFCLSEYVQGTLGTSLADVIAPRIEVSAKKPLSMRVFPCCIVPTNPCPIADFTTVFDETDIAKPMSKVDHLTALF